MRIGSPRASRTLGIIAASTRGGTTEGEVDSYYKSAKTAPEGATGRYTPADILTSNEQGNELDWLILSQLAKPARGEKALAQSIDR
jgi:hypothetical protein